MNVELVRAEPVEPAAVRLCVAVDIEAYSKLSNRAAESAQSRLVAVTSAARRAAGVPTSGTHLQEQGDGEFMVLPAGLDEAKVLARLVPALYEAVAADNAAHGAGRELRLRAAVHRGLVWRGSNGWIGRAATAVHRLVDAQPTRDRLTRNRAVHFALVVSHELYWDLIVPHPEAIPPEQFRAVEINVPAKQFREWAWLHDPGPAFGGYGATGPQPPQDLPQWLAGSDIVALRDLVVAGYSLSDLREFFLFHFNQPIEHVVLPDGSTGLRDIVRELIIHYNQRQMIHELLRALLTDRPDDPGLKAFLGRIASRPSPSGEVR